MAADSANLQAAGHHAMIPKGMNPEVSWNVAFPCLIFLFLNVNHRVGKMPDTVDMIVVGMGNDHIGDLFRFNTSLFQSSRRGQGPQESLGFFQLGLRVHPVLLRPAQRRTPAGMTSKLSSAERVMWMPGRQLN